MCRVSCRSKYGKSVHLVGFIIKKFVTMHGHMNVKLLRVSRRMTAVEVHTTIYRANLNLYPYHSDLKGTYYFYVPSITACNLKKNAHSLKITT